MTAQLNIVSIGMVTAVGLDAPSACAAMRARLDGFQETRFIGPGGDWLIGARSPSPATGSARSASRIWRRRRSARPSTQSPKPAAAPPLSSASPRRIAPAASPPTRARLLARIAADHRPVARPPSLPVSSPTAAPPATSPSTTPASSAAGEVPYVMIAGVDSYLATPSDRPLPRRAPPAHPGQSKRLHPRRGGSSSAVLGFAQARPTSVVWTRSLQRDGFHLQRSGPAPSSGRHDIRISYCPCGGRH